MNLKRIKQSLFALFITIQTSIISFADDAVDESIDTLYKEINKKNEMLARFQFGDGTQTAKKLMKLLTNDNNTGIMDLCTMAGYVILALGIGQMVFAFKDDNADAKSKASMVIMGGVFLILIKTILQKFGII